MPEICRNCKTYAFLKEPIRFFFLENKEHITYLQIFSQMNAPNVYLFLAPNDSKKSTDDHNSFINAAWNIQGIQYSLPVFIRTERNIRK